MKRLTGWGTKLIEKPGVPLLTLFIKSFPMEEGCVRGNECNLCDGKGSRCMSKRVVYQATCTSCPKEENGEGCKSSYIGETSRQVGTRVSEHLNNLKNWKKESFIINHWMTTHSLDTSPPEFKFRVMSKHKDPLSRQISEAVLIRTRGKLNKKCEFATNELVRMESRKYSWDTDLDYRNEKLRERENDERLVNFISVMKNVCNINKKRKKDCYDEIDCSRYILTTTEGSSDVRFKRRKMQTSPPL